MAEAVFNKTADSSEETRLTGRGVKTVSMGWGQEEIVSPKREILPPQKPKDSSHCFFVKHSGL